MLGFRYRTVIVLLIFGFFIGHVLAMTKLSNLEHDYNPGTGQYTYSIFSGYSALTNNFIYGLTDGVIRQYQPTLDWWRFDKLTTQTRYFITDFPPCAQGAQWYDVGKLVEKNPDYAVLSWGLRDQVSSGITFVDTGIWDYPPANQVAGVSKNIAKNGGIIGHPFVFKGLIFTSSTEWDWDADLDGYRGGLFLCGVRGPAFLPDDGEGSS